MQDAPLPTDGDEGNGDQPRRAALRLRDAESVATTRRDMFGDGSLINTLAPPAPEDGDGPAEADAAPSGMAESSTVEADAAQPAVTESSPPDLGSPDASPPEPPEAPQPAAADAVEPPASRRAARKRPEPRIVNPAASPFAQVPQSLDSIIDSFAPGQSGAQSPEPQGAEPTEPPPPRPLPLLPPTRMAVSSIFDTLGAARARAEGGQPADAVPLPEAFSPDMSMLGPPLPQPPEPVAEAVLEPILLEPVLGDAAPDASEATRAPDEQALDAFAADGAEAMDHPPQDFGGPPLRLVVSAPYAEPPPMPEVLEPAEDVSVSPYPELEEISSFTDLPEPAGASRAGEPLAGSRLSVSPEAPRSPRMLEPLVTTVVPEPLVTTVVAEPQENAGRPAFEAAAKIAAEANAAAEALDNLNHLLVHNGPGMDEPVRPPGLNAPPVNVRGDAAAFARRQRSPLLPLPLPPVRVAVKSVYLLGFLTGLGLAVVAGIALYVLITLG
jgi:hypothetical protein